MGVMSAIPELGKFMPKLFKANSQSLTEYHLPSQKATRNAYPHATDAKHMYANPSYSASALRKVESKGKMPA